MRKDAPTTVEVVLAETAWLGEAPSSVWIAEFTLTREQARYVRDELEEMLPEPTPEKGNVPYRVSERGGRTSWGGDSGEYLQVSLFVAKAFAEGWLAITAAKYYERLAARHRSEAVEEWHDPLTRTEAIERPRWTVAVKYRELTSDSLTVVPDDPDSLIPVSESYDVEADLWKIALRDGQGGAVYRVTLGRRAGIPTPIVIERDAPVAGD